GDSRLTYNVIVVGAGLAGLTATNELADQGKKVLLLDQEPRNSLGGQAWWSFGGLFLIDSPEQRWMGIKDSKELAWQDWLGTASFDREEDEDYWGKKWTEKYQKLMKKQLKEKKFYCLIKNIETHLAGKLGGLLVAYF